MYVLSGVIRQLVLQNEGAEEETFFLSFSPEGSSRIW